MLDDKTIYDNIRLYMAKAPIRKGSNESGEVQVYADEKEQQEMKLCHSASVQILGAFLDDLCYLDRARALEVAAGDGQVTMDLLKDRFQAIDCFDQCPIAVKKLEQIQDQHQLIERVD